MSRDRYDAVIFDLDGVITDTARTHFGAWKKVFDELLERLGGDRDPFSAGDYRLYVDGKPRMEGIRSFLASRDIDLAEGSPDDAAGVETIHAVAKAKNRRYRKRVAEGGVEVMDGAVELLEALADGGFVVGLVSSSKNAKFILEQVGLEKLFDARVDGMTLVEEGIAGKPAPDMFVEAARRMGVDVERAVVVEDAESGVEAGRAGGFGLIVGRADDADQRQVLVERGADVAVESLRELKVAGG